LPPCCCSPITPSQDFLATKTLVKSLAKACVQEGAAKDSTTVEIETEGEWPSLFASLVRRFAPEYPSLTTRMLVDAIGKHSPQHGDGPALPPGAAAAAASAEVQEPDKLARICVLADNDMTAYHARVDALRKARVERAAAPPEPESPPEAIGKKRKSSAKALNPDGTPKAKKPKTPKVKKPKTPKKPKPEKEPKDPQLGLYEDELVKKYALARASYGRLPKGVFARLAEEVQLEQNLEGTAAADMPMRKLETTVRVKWLRELRERGEEVPQPPPKKPKPEKEPKDPQLGLYENELVKKYALARASYGRLPKGVFARLAEEVQLEQNLEGTVAADMPMLKLETTVRVKWRRDLRERGEEMPVHPNHALYEEIYQRYCRTKAANEGKLPRGRMEQIVEGVKLEFGMEDVETPRSLKKQLGKRFRKNHPEFDSNGPGVLNVNLLDDEGKKRREMLLNEVTIRYVQEKTAHPHKLADGTLVRIIEQTKREMDITEFEVKQDTIRGRIHRNSFYVRTLKKDSPYDKIDDVLVETLNGWLGQGVSISRAQGLDLANQLLKEWRANHRGDGEAGRKSQTVGHPGWPEDDDEEVLLNAQWWLNFIDRNKDKLVHAEDPTEE